MTDSARGPLRGISVLELAGIGPGPYAAMLLADLGAEVVRVERPGQARDVAEPVILRGRRRVVLDLKVAADRDAFLALCERADVLIEPYRPGVAERLGVGPDICRQRNPRLVYARMTGWGQEGPWAQAAGHDITYIAVTGALHGIGRADGPPQPPINLLGDFAGGSLFLVVGVLAALLERESSGQGDVIDAAIVDGTAHLTTYVLGQLAHGLWNERRGRNRLDTGQPNYDVYATADGHWMAVGALEPRFYAELLRVLEIDAAALPPPNDPAGMAQVRAVLSTRFAERTRDEWAAAFAGTDACVSPVLTWNEARANPQLAARGTLVERDGVWQPAPAPRFTRNPLELPDAPPADPEGALAVLSDWVMGAAARPSGP
ncbi:CoA transferase [Frankia sp. CNm7]|uniref:CoA transferase n=1 Tax=Frankia nepalensis TaxID=1836974 RepID=A0A937RK43_9ACTN|nr:CaiB/BaiF CoA-transferase family protein [Frankia nepalensis]MBL7501499.1 CoA transferase [Frankia nepalensis]MBL7513627.1 CoA transferase [Frankia nepalensis]MBL7523848.1 CoA transferase [Frankia nepalensis]MBL7633756.1 CoA transferase [Frankia nepalensis]